MYCSIKYRLQKIPAQLTPPPSYITYSTCAKEMARNWERKAMHRVTLMMAASATRNTRKLVLSLKGMLCHEKQFSDKKAGSEPDWLHGLCRNVVVTQEIDHTVRSVDLVVCFGFQNMSFLRRCSFFGVCTLCDSAAVYGRISSWPFDLGPKGAPISCERL